MTFKQFWQHSTLLLRLVLCCWIVVIPFLIMNLLRDLKFWAFWGALIAYQFWHMFGLLDDILNGKLVKKKN